MTDEAHRANLRGAAIMVASMAGFTTNDAAMKLAMQTLPFGESMFIRGVMISLVLALLAWREGLFAVPIPARDRLWLGLRVVGELGSTLLYLQALRHMPIGDLSAIMQSLPLFVVLAAALLFGERIGLARMLAVAAGLVGVLLILRPGTPRFDIWAWVALGSVLLIVLRDIATRRIGREVGSTAIALSAAVAVALMGLAFLPGEAWRMPDAREFWLLALAALLLTFGYLFAVAAMRVGDMSFTAPFRYASLLIAILLGLFVFGEWPDLMTWIGSCLVVAAGMFIVMRGARR